MSDQERFSRTITVDCRELEPPEPMLRILKAIGEIVDNEAVIMIHRQPPRLLFPRLREMGLRYELDERPDGSIELLIWRGN